MVNFFRFLSATGTNTLFKFYFIVFLSIFLIFLEALSLSLIFPILGFLSGGTELLNKPIIKNSFEYFNLDISPNTELYNNFFWVDNYKKYSNFRYKLVFAKFL